MIQPLLHNARRKARKIQIDRQSKIAIISDLHKGDNSYADDFAKNMRVYKNALHHYYLNDYTYIELGDGIELWENKRIKPIIDAHREVFDMLKEFSLRGKLFLVYGNHDMVMQMPFMVKRLLGKVIPGVKYYESILLHNGNEKESLLAMHGHQADSLNYLFWWFFRFMVRYVWKPLQLLGIHDPTSPAKNHKTLIKVEKNMQRWVEATGQAVIFGHTHRPRFPLPGEPPMFNCGSGVHPDSVIAIEIQQMEISLVKWTENDGKVTKETMSGPVPLPDYWKQTKNES